MPKFYLIQEAGGIFIDPEARGQFLCAQLVWFHGCECDALRFLLLSAAISMRRMVFGSFISLICCRCIYDEHDKPSTIVRQQCTLSPLNPSRLHLAPMYLQ
jgi:hypothetical protein